MTELGDSLTRMTFMQLLLLFAFVTSYVLSIGGLLGTGARLRFALLALALAVAFAVFTDPWVHGALLVVFVVAGLGFFVLLTWLLSRWIAPRQTAVVPTPLTDSGPPTAQAPPIQQVDAGASAPDVPRGARGALR